MQQVVAERDFFLLTAETEIYFCHKAIIFSFAEGFLDSKSYFTTIYVRRNMLFVIDSEDDFCYIFCHN